jgi:hypothetical protein
MRRNVTERSLKIATRFETAWGTRIEVNKFFAAGTMRGADLGQQSG